MRFDAKMLAICAVAAAGCQTNAEHQAQVDANLDARLNAYHGATISEFIARTGLVPVNAYPVISGKVFVIEGAPVYVNLPATNVTPAVSKSSACRLLLQTKMVGTGGTADDWKIVGTSRSGPCNNLAV